MANEEKIFPEEFVPNIQGSSYHPKWIKSNPNEAQRWEQYRDACIAHVGGKPVPQVPQMASKYGKALVAAGKEHVSVTDLGADYDPPEPNPEPPPPPPPPPSGDVVPSDAYFKSNYSQAGKFTIPPWRSLLSYDGSGAGSNGSWNLSILGDTVGTVSGSLTIVNDPAGVSGKKVARMQIADSDPGWPPNTALQKSEAQSTVQYTWDDSNGAQLGDIRWFTHSLYLPYTASEKYEWAHGGSNAFTDHLDLHPGNGTAWPAFSFQHYPTTNDANSFFKIRAAGGPTINSTQYLTEYNLFRLTESNGSRTMANHNRWISVIWGMKFNPDNTGWLEVWVDGINIVPRVSRPTMWGGDYGMYLKNGIYKRKDSFFPSGKSVIYHGDMYISPTRPF